MASRKTEEKRSPRQKWRKDERGKAKKTGVEIAESSSDNGGKGKEGKRERRNQFEKVHVLELGRREISGILLAHSRVEKKSEGERWHAKSHQTVPPFRKEDEVQP